MLKDRPLFQKILSGSLKNHFQNFFNLETVSDKNCETCSVLSPYSILVASFSRLGTTLNQVEEEFCVSLSMSNIS